MKASIMADMKRRMANPLALAVLALLGERPMHPYEMGVVLRERHKHESIKLNYGSLYTVIEALQRQQFITAQETTREGKRPERTLYALTDAGRDELFDWLRELLQTPVKEYTQFAAGLSFAPLLEPAEVVTLFRERIRLLENETGQIRARFEQLTTGGFIRLFLIEAEHELVLREAELRWLRELTESIADGTLTGMDKWLGYHAEQARKENGSSQ